MPWSVGSYVRMLGDNNGIVAISSTAIKMDRALATRFGNTVKPMGPTRLKRCCSDTANAVARIRWVAWVGCTCSWLGKAVAECTTAASVAQLGQTDEGGVGGGVGGGRKAGLEAGVRPKKSWFVCTLYSMT